MNLPSNTTFSFDNLRKLSKYFAENFLAFEFMATEIFGYKRKYGSVKIPEPFL